MFSIKYHFGPITYLWRDIWKDQNNSTTQKYLHKKNIIVKSSINSPLNSEPIMSILNMLKNYTHTKIKFD